MINKQGIEKVKNWTNNVQIFCSHLKWIKLDSKLQIAVCSNPDAKGEKCVYRNCPKVINNK